MEQEKKLEKQAKKGKKCIIWLNLVEDSFILVTAFINLFHDLKKKKIIHILFIHCILTLCIYNYRFISIFLICRLLINIILNIIIIMWLNTFTLRTQIDYNDFVISISLTISTWNYKKYIASIILESMLDNIFFFHQLNCFEFFLLFSLYLFYSFKYFYLIIII